MKIRNGNILFSNFSIKSDSWEGNEEWKIFVALFFSAIVAFSQSFDFDRWSTFSLPEKWKEDGTKQDIKICRSLLNL